MNQKTKTIGLFTILSLAMVAIAPNLIADAQAIRSVEGTIPPLNYDQLQEQKVRPVPEAPSLALVQLEFTNGNSGVTEKYTTSIAPISDDGIESFKVAFIVTNEGNGEVQNVEVLFESDSETIQTTLVGMLEGNNSAVSTFIKAMDPNSIRATIGSFETIN